MEKGGQHRGEGRGRSLLGTPKLVLGAEEGSRGGVCVGGAPIANLLASLLCVFPPIRPRQFFRGLCLEKAHSVAGRGGREGSRFPSDGATMRPRAA